MANTIRIKRRASGAAGAPASLQNAEVAFNEVDDILYYGKGTGGEGGSATTIEAIGGKGAFLTLSGTQTISGAKTFSTSPTVPTPTQNGHAATKAYVDSASISGNAATATKLATARKINGVDFDGTADITITDSTKAPLASPALTGTPTTPTATAGTNTTQIASTAFVQTAISNLIGGAPAALDTLNELAAALGDDEDFAGSVATALSGKQPLDATLTAFAGLTFQADRIAYATASDVFAVTPLTSFGRSLIDDANASAARTTLGLGSIATQAANNVAITGGSISGIDLDGGTY